MRNILLSVCLATLVALTNIPTANATTGVGVGTHDYTFADTGEICSAEAQWLVSAEVGIGGAIAGDSTCVFQPDQYDPDECYNIPGGVECSYPTSTGQSRLTINEDGSFDYVYNWSNGDLETVSGALVV